MKYKIVLFGLTVMTLMILGSTGSASLAVDQVNRPNVLYKSRVLTSSLQVIKGNTTDSKVELLATKGYADSFITVLRGDPTMTYIDNNTVNLDGTVNGTKIYKHRWVKGFAQRDQYIEDVPVGKRIVRKGHNVTNEDYSLTDNRTFSTPLDFDELSAIPNVTKRTARQGAITGFIFKRGWLHSVDLNETDAQVLAFHIEVKVAIFQTSTKKLIGLYSTTDTAVGNIIPVKAVQYVKENGFPYRGKEKALGRSMISSRNATKISWISLGHNDTLGLDMYSAFFKFKRTEEFILFNPSGATALSAMGLDALSSEDEQFADTMVGESTMDAFDVDNLETVEEEAMDTAGVDSGVDVDNIGTTDSGTSTTSEATDDGSDAATEANKTPFPALYLVVIALGAMVIRKKRITT